MTRSPLRRDEDDSQPAEREPARERDERPARAGRKQVSEYEALLAATGASERRAIETATKTAAALGSVASWIERAQEQLEETTKVASRVQEETAAGLTGVVDTLGHRLQQIETKVDATDPASVDKALRAIERLETRLATNPDEPRGGAPEFEAALRSFEGRIQELSERIGAAQRPLGRRGLLPESELKSAVSEIRAHQSQLEAGPVRSPERASLPALGTLARSQTAILTTLKADVAKLAGRLDDGVPGASQGGQDALRSEIASLRGSVATRSDLDRLENGIRSLTTDLAELRLSGHGRPTSPEMQALQAEIRRLADSQNSTSGKSSAREMEILSHKLDIVAASGVDPAVIGTLTQQVGEVRTLLTSAAAPQALSLVSHHLADLKREVAEVGGRQIDPDEFSALKSAVDEMRAALADPVVRPGQDMARAVRDVGQPIEAMLVALVDKLDRVERRVSDPEALDHLERQIQGLATRIGEGPGRDPVLATLEQSMGDLLHQVATWRDGAVAAAEHAARTAVAETLGAMPVAAEVERHLNGIQDQYAAAEERTQDSLAAVHATLEQVVQRITSLEGDGVAAEPPARHDPPVSRRPAAIKEAVSVGSEVPPQWPRSEPPVMSPVAAPVQRPRIEPVVASPAEADQPLPPAEDEILLEPGAGRPGQNVAAPVPAGEVVTEPADIRSSFIAAARRAAQAAAAESSQPKKIAGAKDGALARMSPAEIVRRVRRMIDERRRPLLLSAAALVLAVGTLQVVRNAVGTGPDATVARTAAAPAPVSRPMVVASLAPTSRTDIADPTTTQSIAPKRPAVEAPAATSPAPTPERSEAARSPAAPIPPAAASIPTPSAPQSVAAAASDSAPATPPPAASPALPSARAAIPAPDATLPVGIRTAALAGNPVALHELGVRTAEGRGVARDPKAAAALFEKAAAKGLAPAQYRTGNIYEKGFGVPRDIEAAKLWYRRAAENGNTRAMHNLAVLLADGGGKPDYNEAVTWFTRAAERGVRDSQFNLAVLHARGLGTAQDLSKAYLWLALAAQEGDDDAGRKRDDVAKRLPAADLARAKQSVETWRAVPANTAANEVQVPAGGWPEPTATKRGSREARA
ncbi:hypothetical protein [uncultured Enterovirga sp.]|uniref:hypothetical protein n=1 Tax=uncultured Enterovirga sp. TaxID=2026352 RepID=UPI0035CBCAEC